jgi:HAE1 family hydrophobic/amphiphilic exporter-1
VVFLILAAQYESWSLPFSVLLGTPIAVFGAFLAIWLRAFENNIFAQTTLQSRMKKLGISRRA